jgi:hypothetical protein
VRLGTDALEQTYRASRRGTTLSVGSPLYAPVGTYTPGDVTGTAQSASYVPLGAYSANSVLVTEPGANQGKALAASFSGRGAVVPSPGAITTLDAAKALTGRSGVDVVRVRVAGIGGYSAGALEEIGQVATQISDLGLDVRIVAGSSLAPVGVYLPSYFADGSDLGWTREEWTSLGAAVRVEHAELGATLALLVVTVLVVTLLGAVVLVTGVGRRRREAAYLATLGWTRRRIRSWFVVEDLPALLLVLVSGFIASAIASTVAARWMTPTAVVGYTAVMALGVYLSAGSSTRPRRSGSEPARSVRSAGHVGRRIGQAHPASAVLVAIAVVVLAGAAMSFADVVTSARRAAGGTRLADLVRTNLLLPQTTLATGALLACLALFAMGIGSGLNGSRSLYVMLAESGWSRGALARAARAQVLAQTLPGAALALVVVTIVILRLGRVQSSVLLAAMIPVPVIAVGVAAAWATNYAHHVTSSAGGRR